MADQEQSSLLKDSRPPLSDLDIEEPSLHDPNLLTSFDDNRKGSFLGSSVVVMEKKGVMKGLTPVLLLSVMAAVLGSSTQFGYNTGVINNPKEAIQESFENRTHHFSDTEMTISIAIFAIGGMLGAVPAGLIADILGRKYTLLFNNVVVVVGVALQSLAIHPIMFIFGRFIIGIAAGVATVVAPLYVSEISPVKLRGAMGVCHQVAVVSTIFLSQVFGLSYIFGRPDSQFYAWRILFALPLLFTAIQLALLPWLPESPKFLFIKRKQESKAIAALQRLRGSEDIQEELKEMRDELTELERPREKVTLIQFVKFPYLRRAISVSIVLHLAQQLGGINGILYYSTDVFIAAGIPNPDLATVFTVGLVLLLITFLVVFLIEWLGRRTLMLLGLGGMTLSFMFFTSMFCFQDGFYSNEATRPAVTVPGVLLVLSSLGIVVLFALGPGVIPWVMVAELFNLEARSLALSIATIINWLANFAVGLAFPYILKYLYPYGTIIFVGTCSSTWAYLYFFLPETKGKHVDEVIAEFKKSTKKIQ